MKENRRQEEELLTPQELSAKLKVGISWVYDKTRSSYPGAFPVVRVGKYVRFRLSDVFKWLAVTYGGSAFDEDEDWEEPGGDERFEEDED